MEEYYFVDHDLFTNTQGKKIVHNLIDNIEFEEYPFSCRIEVNSGDGYIPHFHLTNHRDFDLCICLYSRYYFAQISCMGRRKLTTSQIKKLNEWLNKDVENSENSNWDRLCNVWRDANPDFKPYNKEKVRRIPKYSNLQKVPWYEPAFDPCHIDYILEGTIDLGGDIGICTVDHFGEFWDIPHFHITNRDKTFDICVCVYSNNYFFHSSHYKKVLTGKQQLLLNDWLEEKDSTGRYTRWNLIERHWRFEGRFVDQKDSNRKPDYSVMEEIAYKE